VIWLDSPYAGAIAAQELAEDPDQAGVAVADQILIRPWDQALDELRASFEGEVLNKVQTGMWTAQLWSVQNGEKHVAAEVRSQVDRRVWKQVVGDEWSGRRGSHAGWGPRWAEAVAFYDFFRRLGVAGCQRLAGSMAVARNAGWWWPFRDAVVLTERPVELHRDEQGRLHHPTGPAVRYPDEFAVHAWHGVRVSKRLVTGKLTGRRWLTADRAEVRQAIAERIGYQRIVEDLRKELATRRRAGDRYREGRALDNLGNALTHAERHDDAVDVYRQAAAIFAELGHHRDEGEALDNLGEALRRVRRVAEAIDIHRRAVAIFETSGGGRYHLGTALTNLGLALRGADRVDEARTCWERALEEFNNCDSPAEYEVVRELLEPRTVD
jgi:hypothetical protein